MRLPKTLLMAAAVAASTVGYAASYQWDPNGATAGLGGTGTWDTSSQQWDVLGNGADAGADSTQAVTFTSVDSASFAGNAGTVTLNTAVTLNALLFNTTGYAISGTGTITLAGATPTITTGTGFSASISNVIAGTVGLTKAGAGTLILTGINTYTGGTTVNAGTLRLGTGGSSGVIRGTVTVNTGATLQLAGGDATGYNTGADRLSVINLVGGSLLIDNGSGGNPGNQTLGSATVNMTGATMTGVSGTNLDFFAGGSALNSLASATPSTISGVRLSIRQTGGLTITTADGAAATDLQINSPIVSNGFATEPLTKAGLGKLVLTGVNTYTGDTVISAGTLAIGGSGQLGSGTYAKNITGSGAFSYDSTATQVLSGANTYTGGTTVTAGTLRAGSVTAFGASSGALIVNGGTVDLNNLSQTVGSLSGTTGTVSLGSATLTLSGAGSTTYAGIITGTGGVTKQGAGTLTLSGVNTYTGSTSMSDGLTLSGSGVLGNGAYAGAISGGGVFTYASSASQTLSGNNTYSGGTVVSSGTLTFSGANALPSGRNLTINGGTVNLGGVARSIGNLAGTVGALQLGAGTLNVTQATAGTYAGTISGSALITKSGSGALTLSGNNTGFTGGFTVSAGILDAGSVNALGTSGAIALTGGTLRYSGGNATDYSSRFAATSTAFNIDTNGAAVAFATGFTGAAGATLTKAGNNTLTLNAANAYTGATIINGGTLRLGNVAALGTTAAGTTINTGGTLDLNGTPDVTESLTINGGTLANSGVALIYGGTLTLQSNAILGGNLTFTAPISGAFSVTKSAADANVLTLSGANAYTQGTTVGAGTLRAGSAGAFGSGAVTVASGAVLDVAGVGIANALVLNGTGLGSGALVNTLAAATLTGNVSIASAATIGGTGNLTLSGVVSGPGQLTVGSASPLTLELSGNNTGYAGGVIVTTGSTLRVTNANALGSSQVFVDNLATLNFGSLTNVTLGGISGTGNVNANANFTFNVASGQTNDLTVAIGGASTITKTGLGTLNLLNNNTYTGATAVQQGVLVLGAGGTVGSINTASAVSVSTGATLAINRSDAYAFTNVLSGAGAFEQRGSGVTTLNSFNASLFSGTISVTGGTLALGSATTAGSASAVIVGSGATLDLNSVDGFARPIQLNGAILTNSAALDAASVIGTVAITGATQVLGAGETSLTGVVSGTGALVANSAKLTLSGANTYSGGTFLQGGTLVVGSAGALGTGVLTLNGGTLSFSGNLNIGGLAGIVDVDLGAANATANVATGNLANYSGVLSGTGGFTKSGQGTQIFSGDQAYSGATTIAAGTLQLGSGGVVGGIATSSAVTLAGGTLAINRSDDVDFTNTITGNGAVTHAGAGTLTLSGANTYTGLTTVNGGGTLRLVSTASLGAAGATNGTVVASGSTLDLNGVSTGEALTLAGSGVTGLGALTNTSATASTLSGTVALSSSTVIGGSGDAGDITLSGVVSGAGLTYAGGRTLTLGATNTFGGLTVASGTVGAAATNAFGASTGTLQVDAGATANLAGFNQTVGGLNGSGSVSLGSATLTVAQASATSSAFDGVISGSGALTKSGPGSLTLSGANTYAGVTNVTGGTLVIGNAGALGATGALAATIVSSGATVDLRDTQGVAESFVLNGGTLANYGSGLLLTATAPQPLPPALAQPPILDVALGSAALVTSDIKLQSSSTIDTAGDVALTGVISGGGRLTKNGAGTLFLGATNVYTGGTALNQGTIIIGTAGALGTGSVTVASGATLNLNGFNVANSIISTGGNLAIDGSTLRLGSNQNDTFSGTFSDNGVTGNVIKVGTGITTLTGSTYAYSGTTTIQGGTLKVGSGAVLGTANVYAGNISIASGATFEHASTATQTISGSISGAGSLVKSGSGVLSLDNTNPYTGTTRITNGIVVLNGRDALGLNSAVTLTGATISTNQDQTFGSLVGSGVIVLGTHTVGLATVQDTLTIGTNNTATTFGGSITGDGHLVKTGTAQLEWTKDFSFSANNALLGDVYVNGGELRRSGYVSIVSYQLDDIVTGAMTRIPMNLGDISGLQFTLDNGSQLTIVDAPVYSQNSIRIADGARLSFQNTAAGFSGMNVTSSLQYQTVQNVLSAPQGELQTGLDGSYRVSLVVDSSFVASGLSGGFPYAGYTEGATLGILSGQGRFYKGGSGKLTVLNESTFTGDVMLVEGVTELASAQGKALASARSVNLGSDGTPSTDYFSIRLSKIVANVRDTGVRTLSLTGLSGATLLLADTDQTINNLNLFADTTATRGDILLTGRGGNSSIVLGSRALTVKQTLPGWYDGQITGGVGSTFNLTGNAILVFQGNGSSYDVLNIGSTSLLVSNVQSLGKTTNLITPTPGQSQLLIRQTNAGHLASNIVGNGDLAFGIGASSEVQQFVPFPVGNSGTITMGVPLDQFTGRVIIEDGLQLQLGTDAAGIENALAKAQAVVFRNNLTVGRVTELNFKDKDQILNAIVDETSAGGATSLARLTLGKGSLTLKQPTDLDYSGRITGTGAFIMDGSARVTIDTPVDFFGSTVTRRGILEAGVANTFANSGALLGTGGAFEADANQTFGALFGLDSTTVAMGSGDLTIGLSAASEARADLESTGSVHTLLATSSTGASGNFVNASADVTRAYLAEQYEAAGLTNLDAVYAAANLDFAGTITGSGRLIKIGSQTLNLTGANQYSGDTLVQGGTLQVDADALYRTLSGGFQTNPGKVILSTGAVLALHVDTGDMDFRPMVEGTTGATLRKVGDGTLKLTGSKLTGATTGVFDADVEIAAGELVLVADVATTFGGALTGVGSLRKVDSRDFVVTDGTAYVGGIHAEVGNFTFGTAIADVVNDIDASSGATADIVLSGGIAHTYMGSATGLSGQGTVMFSGESITLTSSQIRLTGTLAAGTGTLITAGIDNIAPYATLALTGGSFNDGGFDQVFSGLTGDSAAVYTLTGTTRIFAGEIVAEYAGEITGTGDLVIASGRQRLSTTTLNTGWTGSLTVDTDAVLETTVQVITGITGTTTLDGQLDIFVDANVSESLPAIVFSGSGTLGKTGAGTLDLGASAFGGQLNILDGTVLANDLSRVGNVYDKTNVARAGTYQVALGGVTSTGLSGFTGEGTLRLTGPGTLQLTAAQGVGATAHTGNIDLTSDATLDLATSGVTTLNGLAGDVGSVVATAGSLTLAQSADGIYAGSFTGLTDLTVTAGNDFAHTAGIFTYDGDLALTNLTVSLGGQFVTTGNLDIAGTVSVIGSGASLVIGGDLTGVANLSVNGGTLTLLGTDFGTGSINVTDGTLSLTSLAANRSYTLTRATLDLNVVAPLDTLTLNNAVAVITPPSTLSKSGAGTLIVQEAGAFSDGLGNFADIVVNAGTLRIASATAFGSGAVNTVGAVTLNGGSLDLGGFDLNADSLNGAAGTTIVLGLGDLTITQETAGTFAGVISGAGSFTKGGTATLTLSGANTYTGGTFVTDGTLRLGAANVLADAGAVTITGGTLDLNGFSDTIGTLSGAGALALGSGTLTVNQTGPGTLSGVVTGTGSIVKNGAGTTLTLSGLGNTVGNLTVNAGVLGIGGTTAAGTLTGTGQVALTGTLSVQPAAATPNTFDGTFTGSGTLVKSGTGTLVLTGNSTGFTGRTTIIGGKLALGNGGTSGNLGTGVIANSGALELNRTDSYTLAATISGAGSVTKLGAGTVTLTANNLYGGLTDIKAGTVRVGAGGIVGSLGAGSVAIAQGASIVFDRSDSVIVANNFGGAGTLIQSGTGTLALNGSNTGITGNVGVTAGRLVIPTASLPSGTFSVTGGTLNFNGAGNAAIARNITGSGALEFTGTGVTALTGSAYDFDGNVTVRNGHTLRLGANNGSTALGTASGTYASMASATLVIERDGSLTGSGRFKSVKSTGRVAPGASPGVIDIAGDFETLGTLQMQVDGTAGAGLVGGHDQINFGGVAKLGGTLEITSSTTLPQGSTVVLLNDTNPVAGTPSFTGSFVSVTIPNNFGRVFTSGGSLLYFAGQSLADTTGLSLHDGVLPFAAALTPESGTLLVHPAFVKFTDNTLLPTLAAKAVALQNASSVNLASLTALPLAQVTHETDDLRRRAEAQRLNTDAIYGDDADWVTYVAGNGGTTDNDADKRSAPTFDTKSFGGAVGIERRLGDERSASIGVRLNYDRGTADFHNAGGKADQDHARATIYSLAMLGDDAYLSAGLGLGYSSFETKRNTIDGVIKGSPTGYDVSGAIDLGMLVRVDREWTLTPHAGVGFVSAKVGGFTETGPAGSALPLAVDGYSQNSVYTRIGAGLFREWGARNSSRDSLRVGIDVSYEHELLDDTVEIKAGFAGFPQAGQFVTEAPSTMRDRLVVGPQVQWLLDDASAISAGYRAEFGFGGATGQRFDVSFERRF